MRASESQCSRNGAISREKKKASERLPVCAAGPQPSGHSPPSPLALLPPPFPLLSSADWCAIHGGPISPFSVLRPLVTIHANEVEQMTFLLWVHACVRAYVCVCVCGWMGCWILPISAARYQTTRLTAVRFVNGYAETIFVFLPTGTNSSRLLTHELMSLHTDALFLQ